MSSSARARARGREPRAPDASNDRRPHHAGREARPPSDMRERGVRTARFACRAMPILIASIRLDASAVSIWSRIVSGGTGLIASNAAVRLSGHGCHDCDSAHVHVVQRVQITRDAGAAAGIGAADDEHRRTASAVRHVSPPPRTARCCDGPRPAGVAARQARSPVRQQSTTRVSAARHARAGSQWRLAASLTLDAKAGSGASSLAAKLDGDVAGGDIGTRDEAQSFTLLTRRAGTKSPRTAACGKSTVIIATRHRRPQAREAATYTICACSVPITPTAVPSTPLVAQVPACAGRSGNTAR